MSKKPNRLVQATLRFLGLDGHLSFTPDVLQNLQSTASGKFVTVDSALQLSAVFACVRLVSETVSTLPLKLYRANNDGSSSLAKDHPLYNVLCSSPNYEMTQSRFLLFIVASIVLWGNSYTEIIRSPISKRIISLDPLLPQNVQVLRNKENGSLQYFYTEEGVRREISEKNIMHIRGFGVDGVMGVYTIGKGRETFGTAMSAEQAAGKFFENGLQTSGFLSTESKVTPEQRAQLKNSIEKFMGSKNAGKVMVLENGYTYNGITMNPEAAQMLETRSFEIEEICRWFRVPPFMIGHMDKQSSWVSSAEAQDLQFLKYSLRPLLVNIEQEISRCLIGRGEKDTFFVSFNIEGLLRADSKTRSEYYASAANNGWMSRNEIRQKENLPPIPGGDVYTIQSALIPLDKVGTNYDKGESNG
ncbi:phage portal protein [Acinetobacter colistiniresistens]|uniref:phage portal protein n=1 Tax=Acinetobacter colistiniresistens TaxID=280145 RepID=UPI001250B335|nr:phage portal protein [Acinetobacter colistiniresistens]